MKFFAAALVASASAVNLTWEPPTAHQHINGYHETTYEKSPVIREYQVPTTTYETVKNTTYHDEVHKHRLPKTVYDTSFETRYRKVPRTEYKTEYETAFKYNPRTYLDPYTTHHTRPETRTRDITKTLYRIEYETKTR